MGVIDIPFAHLVYCAAAKRIPPAPVAPSAVDRSDHSRADPPIQVKMEQAAQVQEQSTSKPSRKRKAESEVVIDLTDD